MIVHHLQLTNNRKIEAKELQRKINKREYTLRKQ